MTMLAALESPLTLPEMTVARALRTAPDAPDARQALEVLARRDEAGWRELLVELSALARGLAASFADVTTPDDVLGDLALAAHEGWIDEWLGRARRGEARAPLRVFLRDRMRDQLREERRRRARRAELLRALPDTTLAPTPFDAPDATLAAQELRTRIVSGSPALDTVVTLREAGLDQRAIARRTGRSPATISRAVAALAALLTPLVALAWLAIPRTDPPPAETTTTETAPATALAAPTAAPIAPVVTLPIVSRVPEAPSAPDEARAVDAHTVPRPPASRVGSAEMMVNALPWCQLSVDGRAIGPTPQLGIRVTPGRHALRCVAASGETRTMTVETRAGETTRIVLRFD